MSEDVQRGWMEWSDGQAHYMESCKLGSCGRVVCACNRFELPPAQVVYDERPTHIPTCRRCFGRLKTRERLAEIARVVKERAE